MSEVEIFSAEVCPYAQRTRMVLIEKGVDLVGKVQSFEYGKFAHIMDPEGNKIELWEPIDDSFDSEEK